MEFLPRIFPSLFPHTGAAESSNRALWLSVMGAVQITLGLGLVLRSVVFPLLSRMFSSAPAREPGALALPSARSIRS